MAESLPDEVQRLARTAYEIEQPNQDIVQLQGVIPCADYKVFVLFASGRIIVVDLKNEAPNARIKPVIDIPAVPQDPDQSTYMRARLLPFAYSGDIVGVVNTVLNCTEFVSVTQGLVESAPQYASIHFPLPDAEKTFTAQNDTLSMYYNNCLSIATLAETQKIVVMEVMTALQTRNELFVSVFSPGRNEPDNKINLRVRENAMFFLTRVNDRDTVAFYEQEFENQILTLIVWRVDLPTPVTVKVDDKFQGILYEVKPLRDNLLYLVGNVCSFGNENETENQDPDAYCPEQKVLDLSKLNFANETFVVTDCPSVKIHAHVDANDGRSKYHLRDLVTVNQKNQNIVWEVFCDGGLYIDLIPLSSLLELIKNRDQNAPLRRPDHALNQMIKVGESSRTDDGVPHFLAPAGDGSYIVGFDDQHDGTASEKTKIVRLVLYRFVSRRATVNWLSNEVKLANLFDVPGIVSAVAKKTVL